MMEAIVAATSWRAQSDVVSAEVGSEVILLSPRSGQYFSVEGVGTDVWRLLKQPTTLEEIHAAIARECDVQHDELWADLQTFCNELVSHGLVVTGDQGGFSQGS